MPISEPAWQRLGIIGSRFEQAIIDRLKRRTTVLKADPAAQDVDIVVREWLGAAGDTLLSEEETPLPAE